MKRALITGITGQDGSFLAELLLQKGYKVFGTVRRSSTKAFERITHIEDQITLLQADLLDSTSLMKAVERAEPEEVYNLAAQSFVPTSWEQPVLTAEFTALGVTRILEAIKTINPKIKFYQASSSEMFGKVRETPQNELTPFYPRSPYAAAKAYGHYITINYRESYNIFACSGILFNHESERRGLEFVTRKITHAVASIKHGLQKELRLGNLDSRRDWGYAKDYVEAMWLMLQQNEPQDFVIATGKDRSIREFVNLAFSYADLDPEEYIVIDSTFFRPAEVNILRGDPSKAKRILGWEPKTSFEDMVKIMVEEDLRITQTPYPAQTHREGRVPQVLRT